MVRLSGIGVCRTQLTKNLRLTNRHGVDPGGDGEQVFHTRRCVVHIEVFGQVVHLHGALLGQYLNYFGEPVMKGGHYRIDLHPVAGGQQHCFGDVLTLEQVEQDLANVLARQRDSLQRGERCAAVGQPHDQKIHRRTRIGATGQVSKRRSPTIVSKPLIEASFRAASGFKYGTESDSRPLVRSQ
jgi:hypothetical protein